MNSEEEPSSHSSVSLPHSSVSVFHSHIPVFHSHILGDSHVVEITETALALIEGTSKFKVRHKPGYQLQIRVGIHSGIWKIANLTDLSVT